MPTTCTVIERGEPCSRPAFPGAAYSLCDMHFYLVTAYMRGEEFRELMAARPDAYRERTSPSASEDPRNHCVYYIRFRDRIKIGTSYEVRDRINSLPHDAILAIEPGGIDLERQRHQQFADARDNREWFHATPELLEHIDVLRELHGVPHSFMRRHYAERAKRFEMWRNAG